MKCISYSAAQEFLTMNVTINYVTVFSRQNVKKGAGTEVSTYLTAKNASGGCECIWRKTGRNDVVLLGYDMQRKVWYSDLTDKPDLIHKEFAKFTVIDMSQEKGRAYSKDLQTGIIEMLKSMIFCKYDQRFLLHLQDPSNFSKLPRTAAPNSKKIAALETPDVQNGLASVLAANQGILFTNYHNDVHSIRSLIKLLPQLKANGVKHLYLPIPTCYLGLFQCLHDAEALSKIRILLKKINYIAADVTIELIENAWCQGLDVLPFDTSFDFEELKAATATERLTYHEDIRVRLVDMHNQQLKSGEKYIILDGAMHFDLANEARLHIPIIHMFAIEKTEWDKLEERDALNPLTSALNNKLIKEVKPSVVEDRDTSVDYNIVSDKKTNTMTMHVNPKTSSLKTNVTDTIVQMLSIASRVPSLGLPGANDQGSNDDDDNATIISGLGQLAIS